MEREIQSPKIGKSNGCKIETTWKITWAKNACFTLHRFIFWLALFLCLHLHQTRPLTTKAEERICNLIPGYYCSAVVSSLCCSSSALFKVKYAVDKSWYLLILHLSRASVHFIQELEEKPRWALYAAENCPYGTVYSKDWTLCAVVEEQETYKTNWWEILIFTSMQFPLDLFCRFSGSPGFKHMTHYISQSIHRGAAA